MLVVVCQMTAVELLKDWMKVKAVGWWSQLTEQTTGSSTQWLWVQFPAAGGLFTYLLLAS